MGPAGQGIQGLTKALPILAWFSAPGVPAEDLSWGLVPSALRARYLVHLQS